MISPFWTRENRDILERALRKAQAGREQREPVVMTGEEGSILYEAAGNWAQFLDAIDEVEAEDAAPPAA